MVYVISNFSSKSKTQCGDAFFIINGKKMKIDNDNITICGGGELEVVAGYNYGGTELVHYNQRFIFVDDSFYMYRVPILLSGKGSIKKIGKLQYYMQKYYRQLINSWYGILIMIVILALVFASGLYFV